MPLIQKNVSEHDKAEFKRLFNKWITVEDRNKIAIDARPDKPYSVGYVYLVLEFHKKNDTIFNLGIDTALKNKKAHAEKVNAMKQEVA